MKTGPFGKPTMNQSGFMSSIVVQNKMNLKRTGNVGINSVKEFTKLYRSVPAMQLANDFAGFALVSSQSALSFNWIFKNPGPATVISAT